MQIRSKIVALGAIGALALTMAACGGGGRCRQRDR